MNDLAPVKPRHVVLLVPGFESKPKRNGALGVLLTHIAAYLKCDPADTVNVGGYAGRRIIDPSSNEPVDLFELYWQDQTTLLSDEKPPQQLIRGLVLFITWLARAATTRGHYVWAAYYTAGLTGLLFWLYGTTALALNSVGQVQIAGVHVAHLKDWAAAMLQWSVWVYASLALGWLSINLTALADVTDLVDRYFRNTIQQDELTLSDRFSVMIAQSVDAIVKDGGYDRVVLVGHSLGAALLVDAITSGETAWLPQCRLITLGSFFEFLRSQYPAFSLRITACLSEQKIGSWDDYFATNDPFASRKPVTTSVDKYHPHRTINDASLLDVAAGRSHTYYYRNQGVIANLLT